MDPHQTKIQNEGATPLFSDSKDDTSPPKKRVKLVSDLDSSEQHRVFDLDLNLPELKHGMRDQLHAMFFPPYESVSPKVFKDTFSKYREDVTALQEACIKANSFFMNEFSGLEEKKDCPSTSGVLETIGSGKEAANGYIDTVVKMLDSLEVDVETHLKSRDDSSLEIRKANDLYEEKLEQLGKIANVDKMIKYWESEGTSYAEIEQLSGLTPKDIWCFAHMVRRREDQTNVDIEANQDTEKFGRSEMTAVLNDNVFVKSIEKLHPFREAYVKAVAEDRKCGMKHVELFGHMIGLTIWLKCAGGCLRVMRRQLKLLYDEDVIAKGYDEMFYYYWQEAGRERMTMG